MTSAMDKFIKSPSLELLDQCSKDQLLFLSTHYDITVTEKLKPAIKARLISGLVEKGILQLVEEEDDEVNSEADFKWKKELLMLKQAHLIELQQYMYGENMLT